MNSPEEQKEQEEQEVAFAAIGKQVVNNKAFQAAMTVRKAQIFDVFCNTKQEQADVREEAWRTMKNMSALEQYFNETLTTGKMAESTLKSMKDNKKE